MTTRPREHVEEVEDDTEEEMEPLLVCLDMLRGASALLRQHKAGLAGLLPSCGWKARRPLERLVADLTDVLSSTGSMGAGSQQQQEGGMRAKDEAAGWSGGMEASGVKRARAQQARSLQQQQQQQERLESSSSSSCVCADPLGVAEVVEHVMSFAEGREVLGQLSRVCRLWRRVSEGERLCLRVVEQHMPCALLGGEESLHAMLEGSARRCLQVHNASMTSGRLLPVTAGFVDREVVLLTEVYMGRTLLSAACGTPEGPMTYERGDMPMYVGEMWAESKEPFSAASLGIYTIHNLFEEGRLNVRMLLMDKASGVVASLWQGPFLYEGQPPQLEESLFLEYISRAVPITSMSYNGPPLLAQLTLYVESCDELDEDEDGSAVIFDQERRWTISGSPCLKLMGQPAIYCERFIRTRLAEEAMAVKQQGGEKA